MAPVSPGVLAGVRALVADHAQWIPGDARIFSAGLDLGVEAADALGDGNRAADLAASRMEREPGRDLLAVAGSQGIGRQSAGAGGECDLFLWRRDAAVDSGVPSAAHLAAATLVLAVLRMVIRAAIVARIYGVVFALGVPVRAIYANALNSAATVQAVARLSIARVQGRPLKWVKTDHAYPNRAALLIHKRMLGEILVSSGELSAAQLNGALLRKPRDLRLGEFLVRCALVDEDAVYEALSLQQGLPLMDFEEIPSGLAHTLPRRIVRDWRVVPFRVAEGSLFLATPELPTLEMSEELRRCTSLEIRFHLVTPARFRKLTGALL